MCLSLFRLLLPVGLIDDLVEADVSLTGFFPFSSGTYASVSTDSPEATNGEPCVEEGSREHHRPDSNYKCCSILGFLLGPFTVLVSWQTLLFECKFQAILELLRIGIGLQVTHSLTMTAINFKRQTMRIHHCS